MPPKTINNSKVHYYTSDGKEIPIIQTIEPPIFDDSDLDIVVGRIYRSEKISFSGKLIINTKNDRNYKSKRYRKNRKGYRGLYDLLIQK